jgi:hypothetical protein
MAPEHALRDKISECLALQKARKGIAVHSLENIILAGVKHFRIVPILVFDSSGNVIDNGLRQDNLTLRAWKQVGIENTLGRSLEILAVNTVLLSTRATGVLASGRRVGA